MANMKLAIFSVVLVATLLFAVHASPEPKPAPAKARRISHDNEGKFRSAAANIELRQVDADVADADKNKNDTNADPSSGRLFMKKFLLFKNIFSSGSSQQQPVIPIIITGGGSTGLSPTYPISPTSPTLTYTSSGTIPSATGTITVTPTTSPQRVRSGPEYSNEEDAADEEAAVVDEQALQAALSAGAQEYVVTDEEIKGTSDGKASKQPSHINLRRKGSKNGQIVSLRIPPKYRGYFKNGQKVMLNTGGGAKGQSHRRRVVKRRGGNGGGNKRRRRVNKNRRNRVVAG